jgi:hypothetical protein
MNTNEFYIICLCPSMSPPLYAVQVNDDGKVTQHTTDSRSARRFGDFYSARDVSARIVGWAGCSRVEGVALTRIEQAEAVVEALEKIYNDCADDINASGAIRNPEAYAIARVKLDEALDALEAANENAYRV